MSATQAPIAKVSKVEDMIAFSIEVTPGKFLHARRYTQTFTDFRDEYVFVDVYTICNDYELQLKPEYHTETFDTLQELANAMKAHCDLRKWRINWELSY